MTYRTSDSIIVPPIVICRRAHEDDLELIEPLITPPAREFFGQIDLTVQLYRCFIMMCMLNEEEEMVAAICLNDSPKIPALPANDWHSWIVNLYRLPNVTPQNSLWIHLLVCDPRYIYTFMKPLMEELYTCFPHLIHVLAVAPPGAPHFDYLEENFTVIMPPGYSNPRTIQTIYLTLRHQYMKIYKIRKAVEEDNDDIVPLIDTHSTRLKEMYGEFYVSEILTKHPEMDRQLVVAEHEQKVVAVLFLNTLINYDSLSRAFNLESYCNFFKLDARLYEQSTTSINTSSSPLSLISTVCSYLEFEAYRENLNIEKSRSGVLGSTNETISDSLNDSPDSFKSGDSAYFDESALNMLMQEFSGSTTNIPIASIESENVVEIKETETGKERRSKMQGISTLNVEFTVNVSETPHRRSSSSKRKASRVRMSLTNDEDAFALEVMAAEEQHERAVLCDLLEACFQSYGTRHYCIFSLPACRPHFALFDHFVRVIPRRSAIYPQELYILHQNAIKANLVVREAKKSEYNNIVAFIDDLEDHKNCLEDAAQALYHPSDIFKIYVMLNGSVITALAIIQEEYDIDYLNSHFKIENYTKLRAHKYDRFGILQHAVYATIFYQHVTFFLRELHRLSDMSILFYKLQKGEVYNIMRERPLAGVLKDLVPVIDRNLPKYRKMNISDDIQMPEFLSRPFDPFCLYISTQNLCSIPRITINNRIVVVGGSNTGFSFLENLIFQYDEERLMVFNNITLVNSQKISDAQQKHPTTRLMFVSRGLFRTQHLDSVNLRTHVNFVNGTLTAINRKNKYITINNDYILPYDLLFLTCGQQYFHPFSEEAQNPAGVKNCPRNVFLVNKFVDAEEAFHTLFSIIREANYPYTVLVYGRTYHAYCALATLQKKKIPTKCIKFVEPFPDLNERPCVSCFNDVDVDIAVQKIIQMSGITVYRGYYFSDWKCDEETNMISSVTFTSKHDYLDIDCIAMFCYSDIGVNYETFSAVNAAGLVYDGKLVIGPDCRTNDQYIFAAGTMTKYARRYYADNFLHKYYNSGEIGMRLARQIRATLLPGGLKKNVGDPIFKRNEKFDKIVPQYTKPLTVYLALPGNYFYYDISPPGKPMLQGSLINGRNSGRFLKTGNTLLVDKELDPMYFSIHLNHHNTVKRITCFTKKEIDTINIRHIWGIHEKMLNNLIWRYEKGWISDFYFFFRSANFTAVYFDEFKTLKAKLDKTLRLLTAKPGDSLIEDLYTIFAENHWKIMSPENEALINERFTDSPYHFMIIDLVMQYLEDNISFLPMYAHPLVTKFLLHGYEQSPLFKPFRP